MKLRIRYENELQILELNAEDTEKLWVSLSLEGEGLSQDEKEQLIQDTWEERFNKPDYNNWHKETRHIGLSKAKPGKDEDEEDVDSSEPLMSEVFDDRIFRRDELERKKREDYEDWCDRIRAAMKPDYAEMIIAIVLDEMTVSEYAALIGDDANKVSHRYRRAVKKFKEIFPKTSF